MKMFLGLLFIFIIFIDQLAKYGARLYCNIPLCIGSHLTLINVLNTGVSFGLGASQKYYQHIYLSIIIILFLCLFIGFFVKFNRHNSKFALILIMAGGCSNLIDRFLWGGVTDFIEINLFGIHLPIFNIADVVLCIGFFIFIIVDCIHYYDFSMFKNS